MASHSAEIKTLHRHHRDEQQAKLGDDLSAHRFGEHRGSAVNGQLEHGIGQSLDDRAGGNAECPVDFFGRQALGN